MNKLFTKIATACVGLAMAVGVGVAVGGNNGVKQAQAITGTYNISFDFNTKSDGTGTSLTSGTNASGEVTDTAKFKLEAGSTGMHTFTISKVTYYWICNGGSNIDTVNSLSKIYAYPGPVVKMGTNSAEGVISFNISSDKVVTSVVVTGYAGAENVSLVVNDGTNDVGTETTSTSSDSYTFNYGESTTSSTVKIIGRKSGSKPFYLESIAVNWKEAESGPTQLDSPNPSYDSVTRKVIWNDVENASSYQVRVDAGGEEGEYIASESPYDGSFINGTAYTVYVKAIGDGTNYTDSEPGSVSFTPTAPVALEGIALNKDSTTIEKGNSETLTVTYTPSNATNKNVTWTSDDSTVASVTNGTVSALKPGTARITATSEDGNFTDYCDVTVTMITQVTFDATLDTASGNTITKSGASLYCSNGVLNNGTEYRFYKSSTITVSATVETIIQINFKGTDSNPISGMTLKNGSTGTFTTSGNDGTWKGSSKSISFSASEAQARAEMVTIVYDDGKEHVELAADDVTVEKDQQFAISVTNAATSAAITGCSFVSNDTSIATVNSNGVVTGVALGKTTIEISKEATNTTSYISKTVKVSVVKGTVTIEEANNICNDELEDNETTEYEVQLNGYVVDLNPGNREDPNAFMLSDEKYGTEGNTITVYGIFNNNALRNYVVLNGRLTVKGNLQKFVQNNVQTNEIKNITVVSYTDDAIEYAKASYNALQEHCNSGVQAVTSEEWTALSTNWSNASVIDSYSKTKLQAATASYQYNEDIAHWIARYTYIVEHSTLTDFMQLGLSNQNGRINDDSININAANPTITIIALISIVGITAIGGYFFLRKKKEQ